ncbi:winged helix-turn-helix transcriptional regulator [Sphingomonas sp. IC081]|uniref:winged helix-turn-helix transcriptional regulator n=1 Tax=Sphingomonas sp. IC081 TaxID=304378 RepID=UPI00115A94B5|nr:helix-turn-helix domain-containing protein [Sphingomonas sp. IC081]QDK34926.1 transcriptional regulator [Sphingomonas sp. IC081]
MSVRRLPETDTDHHRFIDVINLIGNKWTVLIVITLLSSPKRFNEIKRAVTGISQQMLTRTLKALERDGLVTRTVHPTIPPQVEYALTTLGNSLSEPVMELGAWATRNLDEIETHRC